MLSHSQLKHLPDISGCYTEDFLRADKRTSEQFLEQISYNVDIKDLQQFCKTCCFHQNMEYIPVMLQLLDENMTSHYNCNYMLQVWNKKGKKCYEKELQFDIHSWSIQHDRLIFRLDPREKGSEWFYVINLANKLCSTIKVKDFLNDVSYCYSVVNQDLLYFANSTTIKVVDIKIDITGDEVKELEFPPDKVLEYNINSPCKIHGLFENGYSKNDQYILCVIETEDNQIDFSRLYFWSRDFLVNDMEFFQYREVVRRHLPSPDPITQFKQVIMSDEFQFGAAVRQSGAVDLYWNFTLVFTTQPGKFREVDINFDYIYLIAGLEEFGAEKSNRKIKLSWDARIGIEVSEDYVHVPKESHKKQYSMIAGSVRIFSAICLFSTSIFVSHNRVVSLFDVISAKWMKHFYFSSDVYEICRNEKPSGEINLVIFLKNGSISIVDYSEEDDSLSIMEETYNIEGKILKIVSDWKKVTTHYIMTDFAGVPYLYCFKNSNLTNITSSIDGLKSTSSLLRFFSPEGQKHFLIHDNEKDILTIYTTDDSGDTIKVIPDKPIQVVHGPNSFKLSTNLSMAVRTENQNIIVLLDDKDIYKFDISLGQTTAKYGDQNIASLLVLDHKNFYSLSNRSSIKENSGFYYQDINTLIDKNLSKANFHLIDAIVGMNGLLDFNQESNRIAFLTDYDHIKILPVLHRNVLSFFGMKPRNSYITYRKLHDKLVALDKKNRLSTWSVATGKFLGRQPLKLDLTGFDVWQHNEKDITYKRDWYHPICLIRCKDPYPGMTDEDYYTSDMLKTSLPNNKSFISIEPKTFHLFRVIEIVSETEVKTHFSFVHPVYAVCPGSQQQIYFSMARHNDSLNLEYMLEILTNQRVFMYKIQKDPEQELCKWEMIRRINQFPQDINSKSQANYLFSPDLMYYLDYDKSQDEFVIVHTLTQVQKYSVPRGLMNPTREEAREIAMKFKWVDSQRIRVINQDGMEVVVDIHNGFREIAYGQVPMLELSSYVKEKEILQYYFNQEDLNLYDTFDRLKRNYQEFKALYYIDEIREQSNLYDQLFTCDFSVKTCQDKVVADLSFTYLHWRMCEQMCSTKNYDCRMLGREELKLLCVNIFPGFKTILHYAYEQIHIIRYIYRIADKEKLQGRNIEIPFIKDIKEESPLHYCIKERNYKAADMFLEKLQKEGIDNHGRVIVDMLPECIRQGIPCIGEYLENRFLQTTQAKEIAKGNIDYESNPSCSITYGELWPNTEEVSKRLFKQGKESNLDSEVKTEILDVPYLHCFENKISQQFMQALGDTSQLSLFDLRSIQCIIDFQWPLIQEATIKLLFYPYLVFLALFVIYQNVFWGQIEQSDQVLQATKAFEVLLLIFCAYFIFNEARQIINFGLSYFSTSFWNYVSVLTPLFVVVTVALDLASEYDVPFLAAIRSIASLLMWVKLISFLRLFNSTGYLVRTLTTVMYDIRIFLLVLLIIYLGFCEAFLRINEMSDPEAAFVLNYGDALQWVYTLSLGNFQLATFNSDIQNVTLYLLMCLVTVLINIIMLNLIVALLSSSFEEINAKAVQATYQEHARIIAENTNLIPVHYKRKHCPQDKYLFVSRDIAMIEEQNDKIDETIVKIKEIQDTTDSLKKNLSMQVQQWNSTLENLIKDKQKD